MTKIAKTLIIIAFLLLIGFLSSSWNGSDPDVLYWIMYKPVAGIGLIMAGIFIFKLRANIVRYPIIIMALILLATSLIVLYEPFFRYMQRMMH